MAYDDTAHLPLLNSVYSDSRWWCIYMFYVTVYLMCLWHKTMVWFLLSHWGWWVGWWKSWRDCWWQLHTLKAKQSLEDLHLPLKKTGMEGFGKDEHAVLKPDHSACHQYCPQEQSEGQKAWDYILWVFSSFWWWPEMIYCIWCWDTWQERFRFFDLRLCVCMCLSCCWLTLMYKVQPECVKLIAGKIQKGGSEDLKSICTCECLVPDTFCTVTYGSWPVPHLPGQASCQSECSWMHWKNWYYGCLKMHWYLQESKSSVQWLSLATWSKANGLSPRWTWKTHLSFSSMPACQW